MKGDLFIACSLPFVVLILICTGTSLAADTLTLLQSVSANESLVSAQEEFKLGFFHEDFRKFYLGIWFNRISEQTVVWIANREIPLNDTSGIFRIENDGNLILRDGTDTIIWSTGIPTSSPRTTIAQLLDSGNLILRDSQGGGSILWQSFEHPSHALLAGMKIGYDLRTGRNLNLTSWRSPDDPSPGDYTFGIDLIELPQAVTWNGSSIIYRSGPWDGQNFGTLFVEKYPFTPVFTVNSEVVYFGYSLNNTSSLIMAEIGFSGVFQFLQWDPSGNNWFELQNIPNDDCGRYMYCGPNAICNSGNTQPCSCLSGYRAKNAQEWENRIWKNGCIRINPLNCTEGGTFKSVDVLKLPDLLQFWVNPNMSQEECETECLKNCSCTAYTCANVRIGCGCLLYLEDLIDMRELTSAADQKLYVRDAASNLDRKNKKEMVVIIVLVTFAAALLLLGASCIIWKRRSRQEGNQQGSQARDEEKNLEVPCFDLSTIAKATQNFSDVNKIGEGGFGPVYKGVLSNGQEFAVKRLSENSFQGRRECNNEISLIARLQHRNLVKLVGCCIQGEERMLIYEYMPKGSLDSYLFGGSNLNRRHLLRWRRRFSIIVGIARGLLYLHRDSRLRIIHRDLKASNVLLDSEMNPKISDFGMARAFADEQSTTKTRMVAGTFGYMAPEYAMRGIFSMKSDVYSFGVLVLEIVSGQRNSLFHHPTHDFSLLGHAWHLWVEERASDLIDPQMEDTFPLSEVLRCVQVGLLCVQHRPDDRPSMSSVLLMLDSESPTLPQPNRPGFFKEMWDDDGTASSSGGKLWTTNETTMSMVQGR